MRRKNVALTEQQKSDAKQLEAYQSGSVIRGEKGLLLNEWGGLFTWLISRCNYCVPM